MDLKDIAAVSGKSGLFKVVKPTRTGLILETLDEAKAKLIAGASNRVSLLNEISIFTTGEEASVSLEKVLLSIHKKRGAAIPVDAKASNEELFDFLGEMLPEFDREKVYPSDIRKLVVWYSLLAKHAPEKFIEEVKETAAAETKKPAKKEEAKAETKKEVTAEKEAAPQAKEVATLEEGKKTSAKKEEPKAEKPKAKKETESTAKEQKEPAKKSGTKK